MVADVANSRIRVCIYSFVRNTFYNPGVIRNQGGGADLFTANIGSFRFHGPSFSTLLLRN